MNVKEMIDILNKFPDNYDVFIGQYQSLNVRGLPVFSLFDFDIEGHLQLRSCKSCLPRTNRIKSGVVVLEVT